MQADGNGSGAYVHSGIRGGPHVGALRRAHSLIRRVTPGSLPSISRKPTCQSAYTDRSLRWPCFRPFCNCCDLSFSGRPADKTHTLADGRGFLQEATERTEPAPG